MCVRVCDERENENRHDALDRAPNHLAESGTGQGVGGLSLTTPHREAAVAENGGG